MTETQKASNDEKQSQKTIPFSACSQFQKMAEMMKSCCTTEECNLDCCSFASGMMGSGKNKR